MNNLFQLITLSFESFRSHFSTSLYRCPFGSVALTAQTLLRTSWLAFFFVFAPWVFWPLSGFAAPTAPVYYPPDPPTKPISDLPQAAPDASRCQALLQIIESKLFKEPNNPNLIAAYKLLLNECTLKAMRQAAQTVQGTRTQPKQSTKTGQADKVNTSLNFSLYQGHQYNPLYASSADHFDLTYPAQTLRLENNQDTLSANYTGLRLSGTAQYENSLLLGEIETEHYADSRVANQLFFNMDYWHFFDSFGLKASLLQNRYQSNYYTQFGVGALRILPKQFILKADLVRRLFDEGDELDGNIVSLSLASDYHAVASIPGQWKVQVGAAIDSPINERAGGQQNRYEFALLYLWQTSVQSWQVSQQIAYQQDLQGYSPLLQNDAQRHIQIYNTQLQWQYLKHRQVQPYIQMGYTQQDSNIKLFQWQAADLRLGLRVPLN